MRILIAINRGPRGESFKLEFRSNVVDKSYSEIPHHHGEIERRKKTQPFVRSIVEHDKRDILYILDQVSNGPFFTSSCKVPVCTGDLVGSIKLRMTT